MHAYYDVLICKLLHTPLHDHLMHKYYVRAIDVTRKLAVFHPTYIRQIDTFPPRVRPLYAVALTQVSSLSPSFSATLIRCKYSDRKSQFDIAETKLDRRTYKQTNYRCWLQLRSWRWRCTAVLSV